MGYADQTVAEIATSLPGATAVFRAHGIDYCCGGSRALPDAAATADVPLEAIEAELARLAPGAALEAPHETRVLIDHILARYHETHRRELPELLQLAARVEERHASHPMVPAGLQAVLHELAGALVDHMAREEQILFPLMTRGGHPMIASPISCMRVEHDEHGERLARVEALTHGLQLPEEACPTWRALYAGLRKLIDDVHEHVHLENNLLFPRFV
jgi:regulator of cell morphogenesis and NO signaling